MKSGAGDAVGAALRDHAGNAGRVAAELHREGVGDELHFLHGLEGEAARALLRRALQRQPLGVVVGAVHVGAEVPHLAAADVDGVGAGPALHDVRVERQQAHVVALCHRQRLEGAAVDRGRDFRCRHLHQWRLARHRDGLLDGRELHRHVDGGALAGVERETVTHLGGEPGELDRDFVAAFGGQGRERVASVGIRHGRAAEAGGDVANRDGGARKHRLLLVGDDTGDSERWRLGNCCGGTNEIKRKETGDNERRADNGLPGHCEPPGRVVRDRVKEWRMLARRHAAVTARLRTESMRGRAVQLGCCRDRVERDTLTGLRMADHTRRGAWPRGRAAPRPGTCAMSVCEPRQGRKAAALSSS